MARPRVYRHDVRCPECGSNRMPKDGTSQGRQVYHCGDCGRRTIPDAAYQRPGGADHERARRCTKVVVWSGRWGSNPRSQLGRLGLYH